MNQQTQTDRTTHQSSGKSSKAKTATKVALGTAAAAAAAGVVYKAMSNGNNTLYEIKTHEDGWQLTKNGSQRASGVFATKKEAVAAGRELASRKAPSELRIFNADGEIGDSHSYEPETNGRETSA